MRPEEVPSADSHNRERLLEQSLNSTFALLKKDSHGLDFSHQIIVILIIGQILYLSLLRARFHITWLCLYYRYVQLSPNMSFSKLTFFSSVAKYSSINKTDT